MTLGAGTEERGFDSVRYGGRFSERAHYRVYAKYFDRDRFVDAAGNPEPTTGACFAAVFAATGSWRPMMR